MRIFFTLGLIISSLILFGQNSQIDDLWKLYNSKDYKSILEKAKPLLENEPNSLDLNLILGRTYTDQDNYSDAIPYLQFTVANDKKNSWRKAWALNYLGTCYFMMEKYDDSKESLKECMDLNSTKNSTNDSYGKSSLFGFNIFYKKWKLVETENFRFYFQDMKTSEIEKYILLRENAYKEINEFYKSVLPKKIDFFVWKSKADAKKVLKANLGFANPKFCIIHSHYEQTIGHEMTHVISHYALKISNKSRFINEGTAVCFDLSHQDRLKQVKDWIAKNNKQITIKEYWENGDNYAEEILYPLSGLFVKELIDNFGREKFIEFFGNQSYENASIIFGDKLERLIQEFEKKINT